MIALNDVGADRGRRGRRAAAATRDFGADALRPGRAGSLRARLTGKDAELSLASVRMMRAEAPVDSSKAKRELGWQPRPVEESIREAARFWAAMRTPRKTRPRNLNRRRREGLSAGWCCNMYLRLRKEFT